MSATGPEPLLLLALVGAWTLYLHFVIQLALRGFWQTVLDGVWWLAYRST